MDPHVTGQVSDYSAEAIADAVAFAERHGFSGGDVEDAVSHAEACGWEPES